MRGLGRLQKFNVIFGSSATGLLALCAVLTGNIRGIMAWRSSGNSNTNLIDNLHGILSILFTLV